MKKHAIAIIVASGTLLLTGCGSTPAPTAKDGVATSDQMNSIDKISRAMAAEKYDDAASAGYYPFNSHGASTQAPEDIAHDRKARNTQWDAIKAEFDKGCKLVAAKANDSGEITSNVVCDGEDKPAHTISVQYMSDKIAFIQPDL